MKLILATAEFCGPCHLLKRKLKEENLEVESIEMERDIETFRKYSVRSVPTLLVLKDEEVLETIQGMNDIISKIKENA